MSINISGINKLFGDFVALEDINVDLPTGQLTALLGPSGGGKSSLKSRDIHFCAPADLTGPR
jgi:sulfate transport system ATP-binding protein